MHLRLPSDVPSRALRRKAHRAPASGEGLVAPDQRPCLLGVGFPSSGPRVWTFTSSLWVMPLAPAARAPCGCLVADVPNFRVRVVARVAHSAASLATPTPSPASLPPRVVRPAARAPCGCLVADVPAFRVRVTPPFARVPRTSPATPPRSPACSAHSDGPTRRPGRRGAASWPRAVLAPSLYQPLSPAFHIHRHTLDFARVTPTTPSRVRRTRTRVRSSSGV